MTSPLSSVFRGVNFNGAFGNDAQALGSAFANIAKGRSAETERRRQAALEAALQRLKEEELGLSQRRVAQGDTELAQSAERIALDQLRANQEGGRIAAEQVRFGEGLNLDRDRLAQEASEGALDRASREKIASIGARSRENVAEMRQVGSGRDFITFQDIKGKFWRLNKLTNQLDRIVVPTEADLPHESSTSDGQLLGSGARASQGELTAAASYNNLEDALKNLENNMAAVAFQAPGIGTQLLLDATKFTGFGPISSLTRSGANTILGNQSPAYQKIQQSIDALGTMVVKMVTGAQMSEPEAQRIMNILRSVAGDPPDLVQQRLQTVREIIENERVKLGRAGHLADPARPQGFNGQQLPSDRGSALKAKYGLE